MVKLWVTYQEEATQLIPVPLVQPWRAFSATLVAPVGIQLCGMHTWTWAQNMLLKNHVAHLFLYQKVQMMLLVCSFNNCTRYQLRLTHTRLRFNLLSQQVRKRHLDLTGQSSFYLLFLYLDSKPWIFLVNWIAVGSRTAGRSMEFTVVPAGTCPVSPAVVTALLGGPTLLHDTEGVMGIFYEALEIFWNLLPPHSPKEPRFGDFPGMLQKTSIVRYPEREGHGSAPLPWSRVEMLGSWFLVI